MASGGLGKISSAVDWTKILNRCTPQVRKGIMDLRSQHEDLRRQIADAKASVPQIDFAQYRSKLSSAEHVTMLAEAESKLKSFQPTKVDYTQQLTKLEAEKEQHLREAADFLEKLEGDVNILKKQLEKLRAAKPVEEMTVDDVYALHPEYKQEIYDNIKNDNWATEDDKDGPQDNRH